MPLHRAFVPSCHCGRAAERRCSPSPSRFPPRSSSSSGARWPALPATGSSGSCWASTASCSARCWRRRLPAPGRTSSLLLWAVVGGLAGALALNLAYFFGVVLVGAAVGAMAVTLLWSRASGDPHVLIVVAFAVAGALAAMWLQRYVVVTGTAFGGAWTLLVGVLALMGDAAAQAAAAATTCGSCIPWIRRRAGDGCRWSGWRWALPGCSSSCARPRRRSRRRSESGRRECGHGN